MLGIIFAVLAFVWTLPLKALSITLSTAVKQATGKDVSKVLNTGVDATKLAIKLPAKFANLSIKALKLAINSIKALVVFIRIVVTIIGTLISAIMSLGFIGIIVIFVTVAVIVSLLTGDGLSFGNSIRFGSTITSGTSGGFKPDYGGGSGSSGGGSGGSSSYDDVNDKVTVIVPSQFNGSWVSACENMWVWYCDNIRTYTGSTDGHTFSGVRDYYSCSLLNGTVVGDDCSGFVAACLGYANLVGTGTYGTGSPNSKWYANKNNSTLLQNFNCYTPADYDSGRYIPQVGDILAYEGHVEIIGLLGSKNGSWSWGRVPDASVLSSHSTVNRASDLRTYIRKMWSSNSKSVQVIWQRK